MTNTSGSAFTTRIAKDAEAPGLGASTARGRAGRGNIMRVEPIPTIEAKPWIMKRHYAHRMPCVQYAFGLFDGNECCGVVTFGIPATPHLCVGVCGEELSDKVLELNRLCVESDEKNGASMLVGSALRLLPGAFVVVSYADTAHGHIGYIYQATNWIYTGTTDAGRKTPRPDRIVSAHRHGRHEARIAGGDKVDTSIGTLIYRKPKHRYIYFVGNKRERKEMRKALRYPVLPYPKGETRRYDASATIETQATLF